MSFKNITLSPDLTVKINQGNPPKTDNFNITKGYKIEPILWNLTLPSSVTFDNKGNMYIAEAGYASGGLEATPRILKINANGEVSSFVDRDLYGPIINIVFHDGKLYVSNRAKISTIDIETGVVKDNYQWLKLIPILHGVPQYHDIPAKNITLTGQNYRSSNLLHLDNLPSNISTGAFVPFGNKTKENQVIEGGIKCNGSILSANTDGTDLKDLGWGFRNSYGLAFENSKNSNILWVTNGGAEERGNRPIANDTDKLYSLDLSDNNNIAKFYGWPDFFEMQNLLLIINFNLQKAINHCNF